MVMQIASTRTSRRIRTATSERGGREGGDGREEESGLRAKANDHSCTQCAFAVRGVRVCPRSLCDICVLSFYMRFGDAVSNPSQIDHGCGACVVDNKKRDKAATEVEKLGRGVTDGV